VFKKVFSLFLAIIFFATGVMPARGAELLPPVGQMVPFSAAFKAPELVGVRVYADQPFRFDFMLDKGDVPDVEGALALQDESRRLIKYFLASLTIPEKDLWVNLSPEEKDRIIPTAFGLTEMGRDLLGQDYLLKQVASSAFDPDEVLGKKFWDEVYRQAEEKFGTTDIPLDTRHRVWIVPSDVTVYEKPDAGKGSAAAMVVDARLKVMLEVDYLALSKKEVISEKTSDLDDMAKKIMRDIIIPALEKEVNEGRHFARLRQIYHSFILAAWYKKKLKDSIATTMYVDQGKVAGVDTGEPDAPQKIYEQYLDSFRKGVFNFIKDEKDERSGDVLPRKYFSGGIVLSDNSMQILKTEDVVLTGRFTPERCVVVSSMARPAALLDVQRNVVDVTTPQEALDIEANIRKLTFSQSLVVRSFSMQVGGQDVPFEVRYRFMNEEAARSYIGDVFEISVIVKGKRMVEEGAIEEDPEVLFAVYEKPHLKDVPADLYLEHGYFKRVGLKGGLLKSFVAMLRTASVGRISYNKVEESETRDLLSQTLPEVRWPELAHSQIRQTLLGRTFMPDLVLSYVDRNNSIRANSIGLLDRIGVNMSGRLQALLQQAEQVERAYGLRGPQDQDRVAIEKMQKTYPPLEIDKIIAGIEAFSRFIRKTVLFYDKNKRADLLACFSEIADALERQSIRLGELKAESLKGMAMGQGVSDPSERITSPIAKVIKNRGGSGVSIDKGGIDLGAGTMDMKVRQESGEFRFDLKPEDLKVYQDAPGLTPVILSIKPLESVPQFLGST
jgi:hypothetical protein